jgi:hypothetical protein
MWHSEEHYCFTNISLMLSLNTMRLYYNFSLFYGSKFVSHWVFAFFRQKVERNLHITYSHCNWELVSFIVCMHLLPTATFTRTVDQYRKHMCIHFWKRATFYVFSSKTLYWREIRITHNVCLLKTLYWCAIRIKHNV